MNEDRLKHIEDMVEQLIRIGGNTVAAFEELRKGQEDLRNAQKELKTRLSPAFIVLLGSGIRRSELLGLR